MFNIFYTTQMSGSAKMLQKRFTEIRRKRGKTARLAAGVMSAVMAVSMLAATAAMAAIGADGLEYWDRDEIYFKSSVSFPVNVNGKNVPSWVYEDVAGGDGNIVVTVSEYQVRYSNSGYLCEEAVIELSGAKGTTRLPGCTWATTGLVEENFPYPFRSVMAFTEADKLMSDTLKTDDAGLVDNDSGKQKYVIIDLGVDES